MANYKDGVGNYKGGSGGSSQMFMTVQPSLGNSDTNYSGITGLHHANTSTESDIESIITKDGTIKNLRVKFQANSLNADTVISLRVNRSTTALTVTIATTVITEVTDLVNEVAVVKGDRVDWILDGSASSVGTSADIKISGQIDY